MQTARLFVLSLLVLVSLLASRADAQVVVGRPIVVSTPTVTYYAPSPAIAASVAAAPGMAAPVVSTPMAVTSTYYRGRVYSSAPVVTYYRSAPVVASGYAVPGYAVSAGYGASSVAVPGSVARTTYYAPQAVPVAVAAPVAAHAVYYAPGVVVARPSYVPGQPIRNLFRW